MCGIIGIWAQNNEGKQQIKKLQAALQTIQHRGPDHQSCKLYSNCGFGHARLSIIDTDPRSNQPFISDDERFCLVFNGELYNYKELRADIEAGGVVFKTDSDTEVLFELLIRDGKDALEKLDGFFSFAFYDNEQEEILLARDRMGIKPLLVYQDNDKILFASELQTLLAFDIDKSLDAKALNHYFGLTYIPAPFTVLNAVKKVQPGYFALIKKGQFTTEKFYDPIVEKNKDSYDQAKKKIRSLIEESVANRMVSDVPLGSFLSGGVDSSIIAALAIQNNDKLKTFSVGFDHAYFNETDYAKQVSENIGSEHFEYVLNQNDFKANFSNFLEAVDEPFADSSAFAVYLLSKKTKQEVSVALSGDGADELFGGYRKHFAEYQLRRTGLLKAAGVNVLGTALKPFKRNRSDKFGELNRKIQKFKTGLKLPPKERYFKWCQFINEEERKELLIDYCSLSDQIIEQSDWDNLDAILLADQELVLPNDMLKKVDLMSMASSLEVRTPFLDHKVVEYVNSLPVEYKVNERGGKMILKDAFADLLPDSIINRSKKGFEIPIKEWLSEEIDEILNGPLFTQEYIEDQGLFNYNYLVQLHLDWEKPNFADKIYLVWALVVFQNWWNRTLKMV